jgi:hypothetical protein
MQNPKPFNKFRNMKKLLTLSLLLVIAFSVKAVDPVFVKGDKVVNLGLSADRYTTISAIG